VVLATAWWVGTLAERRSAPTQRQVLGAIAALGAVGVVLWGWLVREILDERLRLIIDFEATRDPIYRAWRQLLPDLRLSNGATPVLFAAWTLVLAGLAWWGWRSAGASARGDEDAGAGERADADRPAVDVQREGAVR
jgi:hypothetical protein